MKESTFGDLLRQLRRRAGMTQTDLAAAVGYSVSLNGKGFHTPRRRIN